MGLKVVVNQLYLIIYSKQVLVLWMLNKKENKQLKVYGCKLNLNINLLYLISKVLIQEKDGKIRINLNKVQLYLDL